MFRQSIPSETIVRKDQAINRANVLDDLASACRRDGMRAKRTKKY